MSCSSNQLPGNPNSDLTECQQPPCDLSTLTRFAPLSATSPEELLTQHQGPPSSSTNSATSSQSPPRSTAEQLKPTSISQEKQPFYYSTPAEESVVDDQNLGPPLLSCNTLENAPWKFTGYRILSRWMAFDNAFLVVRRFGALNSRIALSMQDDIVQLEQQLNHIDNALSQPSLSRQINNGSFRNEQFEDRRQLIKEILPKKLIEYNNFINGYTQLLNRPDINKKDLKSVKQWFRLNRYAINPEEARFIDFDEDLIGIKPTTRSCLRQILEFKILLKTPFVKTYFQRRPRDFDLVSKNMRGTTILQDDKKFETLAARVVVCLAMLMLVGPLWILAKVEGTAKRLAIITSFIGLFFVMVKFATRAKTAESLVAAAAYSAVLTVFLNAVSI